MYDTQHKKPNFFYQFMSKVTVKLKATLVMVMLSYIPSWKFFLSRSDKMY